MDENIEGKKVNSKLIFVISLLLIIGLFFCGCVESRIVYGKIKNLRYYGVGLENACELTFENGDKYPLLAKSAIKYGVEKYV